MGQKRLRHHWSNFAQLHHRRGNRFRQRRAIQRRSQQFGMKRFQQFSRARGHNLAGGPFHYESASQSDHLRRPNGDIFRHR